MHRRADLISMFALIVLLMIVVAVPAFGWASVEKDLQNIEEKESLGLRAFDGDQLSDID